MNDELLKDIRNASTNLVKAKKSWPDIMKKAI